MLSTEVNKVVKQDFRSARTRTSVEKVLLENFRLVVEDARVESREHETCRSSFTIIANRHAPAIHVEREIELLTLESDLVTLSEMSPNGRNENHVITRYILS